MGNFLEDFIFGRPNPQTGETTGGIPAVADAIWPFEGTAVSSFVDSGVGQAVTLPVRAPLMIGMVIVGGMTLGTLLTLFVLPSVIVAFDRFRKKDGYATGHA